MFMYEVPVELPCRQTTNDSAHILTPILQLNFLKLNFFRLNFWLLDFLRQRTDNLATNLLALKKKKKKKSNSVFEAEKKSDSNPDGII